ncbi:MAG: UDP-N-acetylmuramoyl-tripeptide--D-alanyl-D-alanine ligase [Chloroflexota bacterium]|nr:UDP-N-acetylmuramoyl-tripeptide--D-alanyl-D-alanine ligase [Chloroflexota bacterium]
MFTLERLLAATDGRIVRGAARGEMNFGGGAIDSRTAAPGSVFFALRDKRDGHDFVADALRAGAAAALVERLPPDIPPEALLIQVPSVPLALRRLADAQRDAHPIPAVGITGSHGKTTAKEAAAGAIGARYRVLRSPASFNNELGVPLTFLAAEASHEVAVVELGFYVPGEIADLCRLVRPKVGIIMAIPDRPPHFSRTPSVEAIAAGKAELIEALPEDGVALLNGDDPRARSLAPRTGAPVVLFGEGADSELRATTIEDGGLAGTRFRVRWQDQEASVHLPLPGRHLVSCALAGIGAAVTLGVPLEEAGIGVETMERPAHRMSVRRGPGVTVIDDSYNASPAAVHAALAVLRGTGTRRVAVLGDMLELGTMSADAHEEAGRDAARAADVLIGVGDLAATIVGAAEDAGLRETHRAADAADALLQLRRLLRPGDTVLIKGSRALALDRLADAIVGQESRVVTRH